MPQTPNALAGRTMVLSAGSRGNGLAIAVAAARHGTNMVLLAKTGEPHPRLSGTVHTAVADIEAAGGNPTRNFVGRMVFGRTEDTWTNQRDEFVPIHMVIDVWAEDEHGTKLLPATAVVRLDQGKVPE